VEKSAFSEKPPPTPGEGRRVFFRRLLQFLTGLWSAGFAAGVIAFLRPPERLRSPAERTVEVGPVNEFSPGQGRLITSAARPFWVIVAANGEIVALPAICTHLRCILRWEEKTGQLVCPCHLGAFDLNGNVLSGPPPRALEPLPVQLQGGKIYVSI
jgi:cytochrome b6-f complex iron-sulfur subunit